MSKGEEKIISLLQRSPYSFEREKSFQDFRNGKYRFDFFLPQINTCIEVDGVQHFQIVPHFHKTRQDFLQAQERDRRKNSFCLARKITLIRIPYWEIDKLNSYFDIFNSKFLVKNRYHNDYIKVPKEYTPSSKK